MNRIRKTWLYLVGLELSIMVVVTDAACTGMNSPSNINAQTQGNITTLGWKTPLLAGDVCEWVLNVQQGNPTRLVWLTITEIEGNGNCVTGGNLELPHGNKICNPNTNLCYMYSYDVLDNQDCERTIRRSLNCELHELELSKWPLRMKWRQGNGQHKGFASTYKVRTCGQLMNEAALLTTSTTATTTTGSQQPKTGGSSIQTTSQTQSRAKNGLSTTLATKSSRTPSPAGRSSNNEAAIITPSVIISLLIAIVILIFWCRRRRKNEPVFPNSMNQPAIAVYDNYEATYDDAHLKSPYEEPYNIPTKSPETLPEQTNRYHTLTRDFENTENSLNSPYELIDEGTNRSSSE